MSRTNVLFDLDGTLTDPKVGITTAVSKALAHFGIQEDPDSLTAFIGPPLLDSFEELYGFTPEQAALAVVKYREYFSVYGWAENDPYPGIENFLQALVDAGKKLVVATSKPEEYAVRIMDHFGLSNYFSLVCGAPMNDPEAGRKAAVIKAAMQRSDCRPEDTIMVGDRRHDVEGAHQNGLPAVGVLYGYGDRAEHEACGADYIAEDLPALLAILLS